MARDLPPTLEGALIRSVRESIRPRLTAPAAAKRAGISASTWGHVERGYKPGLHGADPTPFAPSAQILAHMAYAIEIPPAELEEVGRADAAAIVAKMRGQDVSVEEIEVPDGRIFITVPVPEGLSEERRQEIVRWAELMARAAEEEERREGGQAP